MLAGTAALFTCGGEISGCVRRAGASQTEIMAANPAAVVVRVSPCVHARGEGSEKKTLIDLPKALNLGLISPSRARTAHEGPFVRINQSFFFFFFKEKEESINSNLSKFNHLWNLQKCQQKCNLIIPIVSILLCSNFVISTGSNHTRVRVQSFIFGICIGGCRYTEI